MWDVGLVLAVYGSEAPGRIPLKKDEACPGVKGYEQALWKYYLLDVFHPLSSLEVRNTPQDLKLYKQLEHKINKTREIPLPPADIPQEPWLPPRKNQLIILIKPLVTQKIG